MIKVGCIAPCVGIGGADALMLGLTRYCHNIQFTGLAISRDTTIASHEWYKKASSVQLHQAKPTEIPTLNEGTIYYEHFSHAVEAACKDADIIFTWCQPDLKEFQSILNRPVIEYSQNTDVFAKNVVKSNSKLNTLKVACSKAAASIFSPKDEVEIIYNGIDPGRVAPRKGRVLQRKVWGIPDDKKVLLYMGRMVKEKHPESVVTAVQNLPEDWIVLFVGTGKMENTVYDMCQQLIPKRAAFVKPEYHVGDILAVADCYILPSDFEGHPLALMEAMLAGTPTVCTELPVIKELEEQFGPITSTIPYCSNGKVIAEAILKATEESVDSFMWKNNARAVVWNNFTLPTIANVWEEYFERILLDSYRKRRLSYIYPVKLSEPELEAH